MCMMPTQCQTTVWYDVHDDHLKFQNSLFLFVEQILWNF